jgi:ketosteroid isomerase-like protein
VSVLRFVILLVLFLTQTATSPIAVAQVNPVALVEEYIEATDRDDLNAVLALFTDDAVLQVQGQRQGGHLCDDSPCVGKDAIGREHERRQGLHDLQLVDVQVSGNVVTAVVEIRSDRTQASGVSRARHIWVFELRGDKIASLEERVDLGDPETVSHRLTQQAGRGRPGLTPAQLPRTGEAPPPHPFAAWLGVALVACGILARRLPRPLVLRLTSRRAPLLRRDG